MRSRILHAAIAAVAMISGGCASALVQDDWHPQPTHPALVPVHVVVAESDLPRLCGAHPGRLYGCALRVVDARACIIYTPPRPAAWLMEHERKHCAGWDHGPQLGATIAAAHHPGAAP